MQGGSSDGRDGDGDTTPIAPSPTLVIKFATYFSNTISPSTGKQWTFRWLAAVCICTHICPSNEKKKAVKTKEIVTQRYKLGVSLSYPTPSLPVLAPTFLVVLVLHQRPGRLSQTTLQILGWSRTPRRRACWDYRPTALSAGWARCWAQSSGHA